MKFQAPLTTGALLFLLISCAYGLQNSQRKDSGGLDLPRVDQSIRDNTELNSTSLELNPITYEEVKDPKSNKELNVIIWSSIGVIALSFAIAAVVYCIFCKGEKAPPAFTNVEGLNGKFDYKIESNGKDDLLTRGNWIHRKTVIRA
mmetsp:Transcript_1324/g.1654  ORF Transcript_1324/g.1654 Transcript_1324/m.1654 type:complete len:146 (+) Transcript_1324:31-468(+)|eukprot:jgi/Bigna1/85276/estExt_fgenesh1_pg.C_30128